MCLSSLTFRIQRVHPLATFTWRRRCAFRLKAFAYMHSHSAPEGDEVPSASNHLHSVFIHSQFSPDSVSNHSHAVYPSTRNLHLEPTPYTIQRMWRMYLLAAFTWRRRRCAFRLQASETAHICARIPHLKVMKCLPSQTILIQCIRPLTIFA